MKTRTLSQAYVSFPHLHFFLGCSFTSLYRYDNQLPWATPNITCTLHTEHWRIVYSQSCSEPHISLETGWICCVNDALKGKINFKKGITLQDYSGFATLLNVRHEARIEIFQIISFIICWNLDNRSSFNTLDPLLKSTTIRNQWLLQPFIFQSFWVWRIYWLRISVEMEMESVLGLSFSQLQSLWKRNAQIVN